jgi:hypothetical protein
MTVNTASGSKVYIGGTTVVSTLAAFQALTWVQVGEIEDLGEFGDESEQVKFVSLSDGRTRNFKGPRDGGMVNVVCGDDPNDVGQIAMEAAEASPLAYNIKVELNDAITLAGNDSQHYWRGKVFSKRRNVGQANNIVKRTFQVSVDTVILDTLPT